MSSCLSAHMARSPSNFQSRKTVKLGTPESAHVGVDVDKKEVTGGLGGKVCRVVTLGALSLSKFIAMGTGCTSSCY